MYCENVVYYITLWGIYGLLFRGGILEPEGTVEIKYRQKDLSKTMQRLDSQCKQLKQKLARPEITEVCTC